MSQDVGVWIDHKKAVIVSITAGEVTTRTLTSDVGAHPHYSGSQEGGGEKKYEERHNQDLDRYYDDVIGQLGKPDALLLLELQLRFTWPEEQKRVGLAKLTDDIVVVPVKVLVVVLLVLLLPAGLKA